MAIAPSGWLLKSFGSELTPVIPFPSGISPAGVMAQYLVDVSVASIPPATPWPVYISLTPAGPGIPNELLVAYDTNGLLDGRPMRTGQTYQHEGIQLRIQSTRYDVGFAKALQLLNTVDSINRTTVLTSAGDFVLHNASRTTTIVPLGPDPDTRRQLFTLNVRLSLSQVS